MDYQFLLKKLPKLERKAERQRFLIIVLSLALLFQSAALFFKKDHSQTILVPPQLSDSVWVSSTGVSTEYLEQMGRYYASAFLNMTASTSDAQLAYLLRRVEPHAFGAIKQLFIDIHESFQEDDIATQFFAQAAEAEPDTLSVVVTGLLDTFVHGKKVSSRQISFAIRFAYRGGELFITQMEKVDETV